MGKSKKFNQTDPTAYAALGNVDPEKLRRQGLLREAADAARNARIAARKAAQAEQVTSEKATPDSPDAA